MLSNNADQFMTTPMPTSVTTQANVAARQEMPAPRPTSRTGFLPGLGEFLPGMNGYVTDQAYRGTGAYVTDQAYRGTGFLDFRSPTVLLAAGGLAVGLWLMTRGGKSRPTRGRAVRR